MEPAEIGLATYHTRVERWECDYNDHWNVRFYGRSFQMASETISAHGSGRNPGAEAIRERHLRFHRELQVSAPVEVRSAVLADAGALDGVVVHLLVSAGQIAATALDFPGGGDHLPRVAPWDVALALPRGIDGGLQAAAPKAAPITRVGLGPIRPEDLDHLGKLRFEHLLRHSSSIQHAQFNAMGLTPKYAERARINRMGVEFHVTRGTTPPAGTVLGGETWIAGIKGKAIWSGNRIVTAEGEIVATIGICVVMVNLDTRRAVDVPEFMRQAAGG